jgi:hypothetical protein
MKTATAASRVNRDRASDRDVYFDINLGMDSPYLLLSSTSVRQVTAMTPT